MSTSPLVNGRPSGKHRKRTYFLLSPLTARVKIGTTTNVSIRMAMIQVGSPDKLILLATSLDSERGLHQTFREEHSHGEWFNMSPRLSGFIGTINPNAKPVMEEAVMRRQLIAELLHTKEPISPIAQRRMARLDPCFRKTPSFERWS